LIYYTPDVKVILSKFLSIPDKEEPWKKQGNGKGGMKSGKRSNGNLEAGRRRI
jgi:hypothetical protein